MPTSSVPSIPINNCRVEVDGWSTKQGKTYLDTFLTSPDIVKTLRLSKKNRVAGTSNTPTSSFGASHTLTQHKYVLTTKSINGRSVVTTVATQSASTTIPNPGTRPPLPLRARHPEVFPVNASFVYSPGSLQLKLLDWPIDSWMTLNLIACSSL